MLTPGDEEEESDSACPVPTDSACPVATRARAGEHETASEPYVETRVEGGGETETHRTHGRLGDDFGDEVGEGAVEGLAE